MFAEKLTRASWSAGLAAWLGFQLMLALVNKTKLSSEYVWTWDVLTLTQTSSPCWLPPSTGNLYVARAAQQMWWFGEADQIMYEREKGHDDHLSGDQSQWEGSCSCQKPDV